MLKESLIKSVIPAKAGIHLDLKRGFIESKWIPAFAGMTIYGINQGFPNLTHAIDWKPAPDKGFQLFDMTAESVISMPSSL